MQSDWHFCANFTKERPLTKERPWGIVSLALYVSYRRMMEWQKFFSALFISHVHFPLHVLVPQRRHEKIKIEQIIKRIQRLSRKLATFLIICTKQDWCLLFLQHTGIVGGCSEDRVALTFSPVLVLLDENTGDYFTSLWSSLCILSERERMKRTEDMQQTVNNSTTLACNANVP